MSQSRENRNHVERDKTAKALRELKEATFTGKLPRPYLLPDGNESEMRLYVCRCGVHRRGPEGGVCGCCGGAIPTERELWGEVDHSANPSATIRSGAATLADPDAVKHEATRS